MLNAPTRMKLNGSNKIQWAMRVEGRYLVTIQAQQKGEAEQLDWYLNR